MIWLVLAVIGIWLAAMILLAGLTAAAKRGDRQISAAASRRTRRRLWLPPRAPRPDR